MGRPLGFMSPPPPLISCVRSKSSWGLSLIRVFRRAWEQGKPHFMVVAAEEAQLSGEAFHEHSPDLTHFAGYELIRTNGSYQTSFNKRQQEC
jgi:hypothetical protein